METHGKHRAKTEERLTRSVYSFAPCQLQRAGQVLASQMEKPGSVLPGAKGLRCERFDGQKEKRLKREMKKNKGKVKR